MLLALSFTPLLSFCLFKLSLKKDYMIIACMSGNCMCQTLASSAPAVPLFAGSKSHTVITTGILFRYKMQVARP